MKKILLILIVLAFMAILWRISERLGADALGLAVGVVFGVSAGLPAAILVLASERRQGQQEHPQQPQYQPSVIVLAGNPTPVDREPTRKPNRVIDGRYKRLPSPQPQRCTEPPTAGAYNTYKTIAVVPDELMDTPAMQEVNQ